MRIEDFRGYKATERFINYVDFEGCSRKNTLFNKELTEQLDLAFWVIQHEAEEEIGRNRFTTNRNILRAANKIQGRSRVYRGLTYQGAVTLLLHYVFPELVILANHVIGNREHDIIAMPKSEAWYFDAECKTAVDPFWEGEMWKHRNQMFYFITPGYKLLPWKIDQMLDNGCQPVVTVGCAHKGPITIDQMFSDIRDQLNGTTDTTPTGMTRKA
jgi:hypothetical protein